MEPEREEELRVIGARLKAKREALGLTQADVAARIGVHPGNYHLWEKGTRIRTFSRIMAACDVLDISPNELLGYDPAEKLDTMVKDRLDPELLGAALEAIAQLAATKATPERASGGDEAFWQAMGDAFAEVIAMTLRGAAPHDAKVFLKGASYFLRS